MRVLDATQEPQEDIVIQFGEPEAKDKAKKKKACSTFHRRFDCHLSRLCLV